MSDAYPPSPTPPWARPVLSPTIQELSGDGNISLTEDVTYLISNTPKDSNDLSAPYAVVLPNGNSKRQTKRIYIPKANSLTTAKFQVSGNFIGCTALIFNTIGWSAVLEWVGDGWTMVGGNAERI